MFYGAILKAGEPDVPSTDDGHVLHLSQACLVSPSTAERTYLQATYREKTYTMCVLQKDKCENATLDLFFATEEGVTFSVTGGKNEVHLVGYFEPSEDLDDDSDDSDLEGDEATAMRRLIASSAKHGVTSSDDEEEEEESDEEEDAVAAKKAKKGKIAKKVTPVSTTDEESEDEDMKTGAAPQSDSDNEGSEAEDEEDDDENEEEEEEEEVKPVAKKAQPQKKGGKPSTPQPSAPQEKKRKATDDVPPTKVSKMQKTEASGGEAQLIKSVTAFLKKENSAMPISVVASKFKKPESIKTKWTVLLKNQPNLVVEGNTVRFKA